MPPLAGARPQAAVRPDDVHRCMQRVRGLRGAGCSSRGHRSSARDGTWRASRQPRGELGAARPAAVPEQQLGGSGRAYLFVHIQRELQAYAPCKACRSEGCKVQSCCADTTEESTAASGYQASASKGRCASTCVGSGFLKGHLVTGASEKAFISRRRRHLDALGHRAAALALNTVAAGTLDDGDAL